MQGVERGHAERYIQTHFAGAFNAAVDSLIKKIGALPETAQLTVPSQGSPENGSSRNSSSHT
jgi:hypothetical protein